MKDVTSIRNTPPNGIRVLLYLGSLLLFLGATVFGVTEVHFSTDTWIGLAAGRQILTSDEFPKTDTFSYTFNGQPWYNQNWLTHLLQYTLYAYISPNAVIWGTWSLAAMIFVLTLLAGYWRSGTWFGATIAAAIVGLGCRDFLSARPATTGIFCIAAVWALICALEGQGEKRRWWPIASILPLMLFWGNAHGSFIFGYGVLGLYVGHWYVLRVIRTRYGWIFTLPLVLMLLFIAGAVYSHAPQGAQTRGNELLQLGAVTYEKGKLLLVLGGLFAYAAYWIVIWLSRPQPRVSDRQIAGIVAVVAVALILTLALGPFHLANFTHGEKIASSSAFRQVSEWTKPFVRNPDGSFSMTPDYSTTSFPPMARFWWILRITSLTMCVLVVYAVIQWFFKSGKGVVQLSRHLSLFDLALLLIGLSMTLWARRFAPIFYVFAAPILLTWSINRLRTLPVLVRQWGSYALAVGALVGSYYVIKDTWNRIDEQLVEKFKHKPEFNLLERVTRYDVSPHESILFLRENKLDVKVVTEWTQAGPVMFLAPNAKVYMDGRAQQVYSEDHYNKYVALVVAQNAPPAMRIKLLDESGTDAILLRRSTAVAPLWHAVEQTGQWVEVLFSFTDSLYLRRGSRGLTQLEERLRSGEEWRPNTATAMAARGFLWASLESPDLEKALQCWQTAVREDVVLGLKAFKPITQTLRELRRDEEAGHYIRGYYDELKQPKAGLPENTRRELLRELTSCWGVLQEGNSSPESVEDH